MAKVGLENDTLKLPKCPSNREYSTGQRQLLDIQSRAQMDRHSFSAQNQVSEKSETFLFYAKLAPQAPVARFGLLVKIVHKKLHNNGRLTLVLLLVGGSLQYIFDATI